MTIPVAIFEAITKVRPHRVRDNFVYWHGHEFVVFRAPAVPYVRMFGHCARCGERVPSVPIRNREDFTRILAKFKPHDNHKCETTDVVDRIIARLRDYVILQSEVGDNDD